MNCHIWFLWESSIIEWKLDLSSRRKRIEYDKCLVKNAIFLLRYKSPRAYVGVQLLLNAFLLTIEWCLFRISEISWRPQEISYKSTKIKYIKWKILTFNINLDYFVEKEFITHYNIYAKNATKYILKLKTFLKSIAFLSTQKALFSLASVYCSKTKLAKVSQKWNRLTDFKLFSIRLFFVIFFQCSFKPTF